MQFFYIIGTKSKNMPMLIIGINNILKFTIWKCILWLLSIYANKDHGVFNWSCFHPLFLWTLLVFLKRISKVISPYQITIIFFNMGFHLILKGFISEWNCNSQRYNYEILQFKTIFIWIIYKNMLGTIGSLTFALNESL